MSEQAVTNWHHQVNERQERLIRITTGLRAVGEGRKGSGKSVKQASENPSKAAPANRDLERVLQAAVTAGTRHRGMKDVGGCGASCSRQLE